LKVSIRNVRLGVLILALAAMVAVIVSFLCRSHTREPGMVGRTEADQLLGKTGEEVRKILGAPRVVEDISIPLPSSDAPEAWEHYRAREVVEVLYYDDAMVSTNTHRKVVSVLLPGDEGFVSPRQVGHGAE